MAIWHLRSKKKPTGGKLRRNRKKKKHQRGTKFLNPTIDKRKKKTVKKRGGRKKMKVLSEETINVVDPKTKKMQKAKMLSIHDNKANPHFIRRNIMTKGGIVKTDIGMVRITSRPGQHGTLNGVLIEEKK